MLTNIFLNNRGKKVIAFLLLFFLFITILLQIITSYKKTPDTSINIGSYKVDMVFVKGGSLYLGSKEKEFNRKYDEYRHLADVDSFYISRYEITQELYEEVMGSNPSKFKNPLKPVENVDWNDAFEFCNRLSIRDDKVPVYIIDKDNPDPNNHFNRDRKKWAVRINSEADGYLLPTEKQWEFAARGGNKSRAKIFAGSNYPQEVSVFNSTLGTNKVGSKKNNELGVFDMSGNVSEWCYDWYGKYGQNNISGIRKVIRGGCWFHSKWLCRSAKRFYRRPDYGDEGVGIRIISNKRGML